MRSDKATNIKPVSIVFPILEIQTEISKSYSPTLKILNKINHSKFLYFSRTLRFILAIWNFV